MYSPIQLWLENQSWIFPIGWIKQVEVHLYGVKTYVDFKVIEILDGKYLYLALLGIDWEFDNNAIFNLK